MAAPALAPLELLDEPNIETTLSASRLPQLGHTGSDLLNSDRTKCSYWLPQERHLNS